MILICKLFLIRIERIGVARLALAGSTISTPVFITFPRFTVHYGVSELPAKLSGRSEETK